VPEERLVAEQGDPIQQARLEELRHRVNEIELVIRTNGRIVEANDRALHAYGYARDELLRLRITDLRAPATLAEVSAQMARALGPDGVRFETEHRRRDGTTFPVEVSSRSFRADGEVYLHSLVRDLTEQRRLEEERATSRRALEESEARFRDLADSAPVLIWIAGPDGGCTWFNRGWLEFTGRGLAQELGDGWAEGVHPEDLPRCREIFEASLVRRAAFKMELRLRRFDGAYRWIVGSGKPRLDGGAFAGYVGSAMDITERKESEEELRRLAAAVDQAPASVEITDAAGCLVYVNPAFERTTGYARGEVVGRKPSVVKSGVHPQEFYADLWRTVTAGRVWHGRFVNRARDGRLFTEDAVIAPVKDAAGVIRNYVAVKRDVTSELALQQHVSESQRLDSVAMLAGGIAHDFNNLLTVILSAAETLKHGRAGGETRQLVEEVQVAGERARDLTRKLLAFARRQVIEPVPLDLNAVVRDCERLLRRVLTEDIALVTSLEPDLWAVRSDPAQMEQVVLNLAVNARDAMPGGGKLTLETTNVELDGEEAPLLPGLRPGPHVRFVVQDTGTGMAPEVKARAFEPFFTTKPVGKGTGLGLATVHGIVKQSGGHVRLESEPGRGARFELFFPRTLERVAPCAGPAAHTIRGSETVLLVEDDPRVRRITSRALRSGGYEVLVAGEGAEALRIVADASRRVDLLLSDVVMPGIDGPQLAQLVRSRRPGIRVLFVSGHAHDVLASRGLAQARAELLDKPFTPASLLARVREVLDAP
jgi:PAS domain S-box-containing protein